MLQQIRKTANSTPFKIVLALLAVSFALSVSDNLSGPSSKDIASFKDITPVTYNDFARTRSLKIRQIQQNSNEPISEEQITAMGLNQLIVQNLITGKLLEFLAYKFDLDFSDKVMADFVRAIPMFRNDSNSFDIDNFKSFLRSQNLTEDEYSDEVRISLAKEIITSSLVGNSYVPKIRTNNIILHMSEIRKVDVASISLTSPSSEPQNFATEDLQNFYKENGDLFKSNEVRDICYAKLLPAKGKKKDDADAWMIETSKALEDEVAGGATLQEIATKYNLKRTCEKNITSDNIETRAEGLFTNFSTQISEMADKEVSYPLTLPGENGQILLEITRLEPEQIKAFDDVKDQVSMQYATFLRKQEILKKLQTLAGSTSESTFASDAARMGLSAPVSKDYIRADLNQDVNFPPEMLISMFASDKGKAMGPFITDDSAYMFIVRSVGYDQKTKAKLSKEAGDNIVSKLREGMFEELLMHAQSASKMKMNKDFKLDE